MITKFYGRNYSLQYLRDACYITKEGVSLRGINDAAEKIGFRTLGARLSFEQLDEEVQLPCVLHWNQNHFVVLPPQNYNAGKTNNRILIADPAHGLVRITKEDFLRCWIPTGSAYGFALLLEPTPLFYEAEDEKNDRKDLTFLLSYLKPHKSYIGQLFLGMSVASILSLIAPFLTQSLVDHGINLRDIGFVYLILAAQLAVFVGETAIEAIRGWLLLHMITRVNISVLSDFLIKLMRLPIRFFDTKMVGDITQRLADHSRIEQFLTGTSLNTLFSLVNLIIFSFVLGIYSTTILLIFLIGSALSIMWIAMFLKKRKELDYAKFQRMSDNQNSLFEIITGMQEIKMNDSEATHRWAWERIQAKLFKINVSALGLGQYQHIGSSFFTQLKNILISFVAAKQVLSGDMTLGMMLSVSYITGQLNSPITQLLTFFHAAQDAQISFDRLREIHNRKDEENEGQTVLEPELDNDQVETTKAEQGRGIVFKNVSFSYGGPDSRQVLSDIFLKIPFGKVTAIVGASGSGKSTLMKLMLKFYEPVNGEILVGETPLDMVSAKWWRKSCGVVMSDGYIFSNTIASNIAVQDRIDKARLIEACKTANIDSFIRTLPLGLDTKIGNTGNGISSGQRQRILIARAVYKHPKFLFLDEATSTLDANNEKVIIENLNEFFHGRTVVVIAHRLSTVKHADQIVVLEDGKIVELGNHESLTQRKGKYYELVKNQLELGK